MAQLEDVKDVCDRLAPLGWRDLLNAVTGGELDISQPSGEMLRTELQKPLSHIDRTFPGFEDFAGPSARGIAAGNLSQSLLYHAFASPRVTRDHNGALLGAFPTIPE